jgi:hypothetical protein
MFSPAMITFGILGLLVLAGAALVVFGGLL